MLVITPKFGERIYIGDDISIVLRRPGGPGNDVRVTIDAPRHVKVLRGSLIARAASTNA
jgi:carbon storage regulator CsrA